MNLHYSQTAQAGLSADEQFFYHMNLHYSQTLLCINIWQLIVFLPYEFTLLSNSDALQNSKDAVFLPYEFTLLSNGH